VAGTHGGRILLAVLLARRSTSKATLPVVRFLAEEPTGENFPPDGEAGSDYSRPLRVGRFGVGSQRGSGLFSVPSAH
jgi:hypothetical protein